MIKRGVKGKLRGDKGDSEARVIDTGLKGTQGKVALAVMGSLGTEYLMKVREDGTSLYGEFLFIPSNPWDSLKHGDACFVRDYKDAHWSPRVFSGVGLDGRPKAFGEIDPVAWIYCVPAKLIDGELFPVEEE